MLAAVCGMWTTSIYLNTRHLLASKLFLQSLETLFTCQLGAGRSGSGGTALFDNFLVAATAQRSTRGSLFGSPSHFDNFGSLFDVRR